MVSFKHLFISGVSLVIFGESVLADKKLESTLDKMYLSNAEVRDPDSILDEFKKLTVGVTQSSEHMYRSCIDKLNAKDKDAHKDFIKANDDKKAELDKKIKEALEVKSLEKEKLIEAIDKVTDAFVEYKQLIDDSYQKAYETLEGDAAKDFELMHKKIKAYRLTSMVTSWSVIMTGLNRDISGKDTDDIVKKFNEVKTLVCELRNKLDKTDSDYNAVFNDILKESANATAEFQKSIDVNVASIEEYGINIDSDLVKKIKGLTDTITNVSHALIPCLMSIALSSLIIVMS